MPTKYVQSELRTSPHETKGKIKVYSIVVLQYKYLQQPQNISKMCEVGFIFVLIFQKAANRYERV
jgi:hypothetical protein